MKKDSLKDFFVWAAGGYPIRRAIVIVEDDEPKVVAFFPDVELDMIRIDFDPDGIITIDTSGYSFLTFDAEIISMIAVLAEDASDLVEELWDCWDDDQECWGSFGHLITHPRPIDLHETLA